MPTEISATDAARSFGDLLARVRYRGESFLIRRGKTVVARLGPPEEVRLRTGAEIAELWRRRPRLDPRDAAAYAKDVRAARRRLNKPPRDPWQP